MSHRSARRTAYERSASWRGDESEEDNLAATSSSFDAHQKCTSCGGSGCNKGSGCGSCKKKDSHACCVPTIALPQIKHLGPNTTISGSLTVTGPPLQLNGIIDAANAVFNNLVIGDVDFNDATFTGNTLVQDNLEVDGPSIFNQGANFNSSSNFEGPSTFNGPAVYNGDLTINGTVEFGLGITFSGDITFDGTITYEGVSIFNDQSIFNELVTFNNEVDFSSPVTFDFPVTVNNTIEFNGTIEFNTPLDIDVDVTISGTTTFTGEVIFDFPLTINVDVTFNGTVTFNNVVTYTDTVTFEEEVLMEGPLDIEIQDPLPPGTPALKICQNTPEPTTLDLCNQNPAGGSQIVFSGPPGNEPAIQSIPPNGVIPAGVSVMVPVVGAIAPIAALAIPALQAAGVAGGVPVAAAAAAAAGAGGGAAGVAAAAAALAGAAGGAGAIVGAAGIVAAPVFALTGVTGGLPTGLPKGAITLDPLTLDLKNGDESIVTWKPNVTLPNVQGVNTTSDGDVPTTSDGDIPTSPQQALGPNDPKTIGTADPTKPATIGVPTLIVDSSSSPTSFILAGPCDEDAVFQWDCATGTLQLSIVDNSGPTTTIVQEWTQLSTTIFNTFVTAGPTSFVDVTLTGTTTIQDVLNVTAVSNFTGDVTLNNQTWVNGSTISISGGGTITALGAGTLDLSAWTVIIPSPGFNDITLTGTTTIQNVLNVTAAATFSDGIDLVPQAANPRPGGNPTLWADSTTSNSFRYEDNPVIVSGTTTTVVDEIPYFSSTFGTLSSAQIAGNATINRSIVLNTLNVIGISVQGTQGGNRIVARVQNLSPTSSGAGIRFGTSTGIRWDVGIDQQTHNNTNAFTIFDAALGGTPALTITGSQMVQLRDGIELQFSKYFPQAAIPVNANATSIWVSSVDPTRPRWGTTEQLALLSDIIAPTYNNVTLTGTTTVNGTLQVNAVISTFQGVTANFYNLAQFVTNPAAVITNLWLDSTLALRLGGNIVPKFAASSTTADVVPVVTTTNGNLSTVASATTATLPRPLTVTNLITAQDGVQSERLDLTVSVANPGGNTTVWANTLEDTLMYRDYPVVTTENIGILVPLFTTQAYSLTLNITLNNWTLSPAPLSMDLIKVGRIVTAFIDNFDVTPNIDNTANTLNLIPQAPLPPEFVPLYGDVVTYIAGYWTTFNPAIPGIPFGSQKRVIGLSLKWDTTLQQWQLCDGSGFLLPLTVDGSGNADSVSFPRSIFTYITN